MECHTFQTPPAYHSWRPERKDRVLGPLERASHLLRGQLRKYFGRQRSFSRLIEQIGAREARLQALGDDQLRDSVDSLRHDLLTAGLTPEMTAASFALIRETSRRYMGMRHYDSQLHGGLALMAGMVAEMETGEGKTLTAPLAAATAALAGIPVHVISVNDYLTARDAEIMTPLYQALGLSVACVVQGQTPELRRQAYLADVTYVTNKELVFDYLRDRLTLDERLDPLLLHAEALHSNKQRTKRLLLRGLHFAIVDEVDSILIDEARTPLILSGTVGCDEEQEFLTQALQLAGQLEEDVDYFIDRAKRKIYLEAAGRQQIEEKSQEFGELWSGLVRREAKVLQALNALYLFQRDEHYLVSEGKVQIVDEFTGRVMADRSWEQGLHQLIEIKEGCELTQRREALAKISYQRFFRRYLHLSGMTGTAKEVAGELWSVYHLATCRIQTHKPIIRQQLPVKVYPDQQSKWQAVVARILELHACGRPVLIGTPSVAVSEQLAQLVTEAGLPRQVLNARQDAEEARIIALAGQVGSITIATNMAGRGTDIKLADEVRKRGGLHVIMTEKHEAARIDRQLAGRCGRQGDPGSFETLLCLDDQLFVEQRSKLLWLVRWLVGRDEEGCTLWFCHWLFDRLQQRVEKYHGRMRRHLFKQDQAQGSLLSFSGRLE